MATRTPWACRVFFLLLGVAGCTRKPSGPTLGGALGAPGGASGKAKALVAVALAGPAEERREAAMLWGLYACDAASPASALRAFSLAQPKGGEVAVVARRLEEAASRRLPPEAFFLQLQGAGFLTPESRERVLLAACETALRQGDLPYVRRVLPKAEEFTPKNRARVRALRASLWPEESASQKKAALLEAPQDFPALFPSQGWESVASGFTRDEWRRLARAFLDAGMGEQALRAAVRADAPEVAAKAALSMRRLPQAESWAQRLPPRSPERALLLCRIWRQKAWAAEGSQRSALFARLAEACRHAPSVTEAAVRAELQLLRAEALLEQGQLSEVPALLAASAGTKPPRWDWVARRALMAFALKGRILSLPEGVGGPRLTRLARFWAGWVELNKGNPSLLRELAVSGHPDLPAQWAARLSGASLRWSASHEPLPEIPPPPWASWWLKAGRVADVVLGWRAELEAGIGSGSGWLGLARLGNFPPLDAVPLLVRAEPRLYTGPWDGLPRELLRQYLPLPYRGELEAAAHASGVPVWILAALVRQESAFNPRSRSPKGAVGLAQLLPATAGLSASRLEDPETNLRAGARLLRKLLDRFGGAWEPALAAYNAGESRVAGAWEEARREGPLFVERLELPETWDYVHRVLLLAQGYRALYWPEQPAQP